MPSSHRGETLLVYIVPAKYLQGTMLAIVPRIAFGAVIFLSPPLLTARWV